MWENELWIMVQDNVTVYNEMSVKKLLAIKYVPLLEHPPHSADFTPCDLNSPPMVKNALKQTYFPTAENSNK